MMTIKEIFLSLLVAFLIVLVSQAQNFDCANEEQVMAMCALANTTISLSSCVSCVYPLLPENPTSDCSAYNDQICGSIQDSCSGKCPLVCVEEFNAWASCAVDHPQQCNVTCSTTEESSATTLSKRISMVAVVGAGWFAWDRLEMYF